MGWRAVDAGFLKPDERRPVVDRPAEAVKDAAEELFADAHRERAPCVLDQGPDAQPGRVPVGETRHALAAEGDDLGQDRLLALA